MPQGRNLRGKRDMVDKNAVSEGQIRHLAFQIAAQLPEDVAEALRVLDYTKKLVLHAAEDPEPPLRIVKPD